MNLKQLRYFCEVVDMGSARAAAENLFVAPTAISMQLSQLEEHLGGLLFDRTSRPMRLTALGQFVYPKARELLSSSSRLAEEAKGMAQGELGWLGIGFTRSTLFSVVPAAVRTMKAAYPKVRIDLGEVLTEHQSEKLRQGVIHVGISRTIGSVAMEPDLAYLPLFDDPMVAALPADHPMAAKDSVCVGDFGALPFISYPKDPSSHFSRHVLYLLKMAGGRPYVGYEAQEIHTALGLVAAGLGVTVTGRSVAAQNRTDVRFLPIDGLTITSCVYAVHHGGNNPVVDAFLQILQRQVQLDTVAAAGQAPHGLA